MGAIGLRLGGLKILGSRWRVFRHYASHRVLHFLRVARARRGYQFGKPEIRLRTRALGPELENPRVFRRLMTLFRMPELFIELLTWANSCDLDFDVRVGLVSRELDHLACQVHDLHGLA